MTAWPERALATRGAAHLERVEQLADGFADQRSGSAAAPS